jgi:hypothetical protein
VEEAAEEAVEVVVEAAEDQEVCHQCHPSNQML